MQRVLIQNNLYLLDKYDFLRNARLCYAPVFRSPPQRAFFLRRFAELKRRFPQIEWTESISDQDYDVALAWDAAFEQKAFGVRIYPEQNRLFAELPFETPNTFTPFRDKALKLLPASYPAAVSPADADVQRELKFYFRERRLPLTYLETRNQMVGREGSTKFSAFLSSGALDVRHLYNEVRAFEQLHGASDSTGWLIYELLWREFFYWHYQLKGVRFFSKNGIKGELDFSEVQHPDVQRLMDLPAPLFFRAALRELTETGFLSNRARQIFASIWINDLGLDWRAGAALFEDWLIDYDVFSNYGNWMYLAGVGVDPRGKRVFNVEHQLQTYDPEGAYLSTWGRS
jgi:deoxyribodipyrimidine photo-lyase